jgi:protein STU2
MKCVGSGIASPRMSRYLASPTSERPPMTGYSSSSSAYGNSSNSALLSNAAPPAAGGGAGGAESWKRAAEVTQNLKARIEMMKV